MSNHSRIGEHLAAITASMRAEDAGVYHTQLALFGPRVRTLAVVPTGEAIAVHAAVARPRRAVVASASSTARKGGAL